jgi:hypothetical protein
MILASHGLIASQISQFSGLLDLYPSAAAAYSLRRLRGGYTGSAIRVRRTDLDEMDIGFTPTGELDTTALLAFTGTGALDNGFVKTWYDQSGSARNATQSTAINQPQIVINGGLITRFGKPYIKASNTMFLQLSTLLETAIGQSYSYWMTYEKSNTSNQAVLLNSAGTYHWLDFGTDQYCTSNDFITISSLFAANTMYLNNVNTNYTVGANQYRNNTLLGTRSALTNLARTSFLPSNSFRSGDLTFNELIFYPFNQDANRLNITTNINDYYGIY